MASICRLCATLKKVENFVHIHDPNLNLCKKLERCCQLTVAEEDTLPKNVCNDCVQSLDISWKFSERVREAQESLQKIFLPDLPPKCEQKFLYEKLSTPSQGNEMIPHSETLKEVEPDQDVVQSIEIEERDTGGYEMNICLKVEDYEEVTEHVVVPMENEIDEEKLHDIGDIIEVSEASHSVYNSFDVFEDPPGTPPPKDDNKEDNQETWRDYPWNCTMCSTTYPTVGDLQTHFAVEHSSQNLMYICADCSKPFDKYYLLINHVRYRHRPHLATCCDICSQTYGSSHALANHLRTAHEGVALILCPACGKVFKSDKALQIHSVCHRPEEERYKYACEMCGKKFGTRPNLKAHLKIHAGLRDFVCDQCGKSFVQKANLQEHLLTHVNTKPYLCQDCGKSFKTPARLAKHKVVHTDVKAHKCEHCGRFFREKDTLRVHLRIHTGVMPYECEFCGKRFRFRSILVTHRHQHTGVRPYSCVECNHHFTNWPNYNKHMKRVHGINKSLQKRAGKSDDVDNDSFSENGRRQTTLAEHIGLEGNTTPTDIESDPKQTYLLENMSSVNSDGSTKQTYVLTNLSSSNVELGSATSASELTIVHHDANTT